MYTAAQGNIRQWEWDPSRITQRDDVALGAGSAAQVMISAAGQWNCARVVTTLPVAYQNIVFELWAHIGRTRLLLQSTTPALAAGRLEGGNVHAALFVVSGIPCDQFVVLARGNGTELSGGELSLLTWGDDCCGAAPATPLPGGEGAIETWTNDGAFIPGAGVDAVMVTDGQTRWHQTFACHADGSANVYYLMHFNRDAATPPVATDVPLIVSRIRYNPDQQASLASTPPATLFPDGLWLAVSSTDRTLTPVQGDIMLATVWFSQP